VHRLFSDEHADLKIELKVLQEKNNNYMKSVIELEEVRLVVSIVSLLFGLMGNTVPCGKP
jgi:hypothetical protein